MLARTANCSVLVVPHSAEVVRRLEQGGDSLAESIALWERGERLAQVCQTWLDGARKKLDAAITGAEADG